MPDSATRPTLFLTTRWTLIRDAAAVGDGGASAALGDLCAIYWMPLYRYARRRGHSREDAEDLVQGFLSRIAEPRHLSGLDASKGRFRAFLLSSFNHWRLNEWKRGTRLKRGGGAVPLALDWQEAESGCPPFPADELSPDKHYDREWALTLLAKVLADLEAASIAEGKGVQFGLLKSCLTADSARIPYAEIARRLDTTEGAARVAVHRLRKRYRHLLTGEILRTLSSRDALEEEMRSLFAALAS